MPKLDLYLIAATNEAQRVLFTCRLVEKAFRRNEALYLLVDDEHSAQYWDEALWTILPMSFIPHGIDSAWLPISIGQGPVPEKFSTVLNLGAGALTLHPHVSRVLEIVSQEPEVLTQSRIRYRVYQQHAYDIIIHDLKTSSEESSNG